MFRNPPKIWSGSGKIAMSLAVIVLIMRVSLGHPQEEEEPKLHRVQVWHERVPLKDIQKDLTALLLL